MRDSIRLSHFLLIISISTSYLPVSISAVRCASCEGEKCSGKSCQGDYCVMSRFVPRWGTTEFHKSILVKGCLDGSLLSEDIEDHCEVSEDDEEVFTCFCNGKDDCQAGAKWKKIEKEFVPLVRCDCEGAHCEGKECIGELCTYVEHIDKGRKSVQKGCLNASIPILERRSVGACMIPPITGAMHHHINYSPRDLLRTESCICGTNFCNRKKLKVTKVENSNCTMYAKYKIHGAPAESKQHNCQGEYCFMSSMNSTINQLQSFSMAGCASFAENAELAEEMKPSGCARFESENLQVKGCFMINDKKVGNRKNAKGGKKTIQPKPKMEIKQITEDEEEEEEEEGDQEEQRKGGKDEENEKEEEKEEEEKEEEKGEEEEDEEEGNGEGNGGEKGKDKSKEDDTEDGEAIYKGPKQEPIPDESNAMMITVFVLIILVILAAGAVWKFELHKRLFRANYDTVAGG